MASFIYLIAAIAAGPRPGEPAETINYMCSKCVLYDTESESVFDYNPEENHQKPINRTILQKSQSLHHTMLTNTFNIELNDEQNITHRNLVQIEKEILNDDHNFTMNLTNIFVSLLSVILCIVNIFMTFLIYNSKKKCVLHYEPCNCDISENCNDQQSYDDNWN